jgi:hypothetical protein
MLAELAPVYLLALLSPDRAQSAIGRRAACGRLLISARSPLRMQAMTCARGHKAGGTDRTQTSDEAASWRKGDRLAVVDDCGDIGPPAGVVFSGGDVACAGQPPRLRYARIAIDLRARSRAASGTRGCGARRSSLLRASCGACGPGLPSHPNACQAQARFLHLPRPARTVLAELARAERRGRRTECSWRP